MTGCYCAAEHCHISLTLFVAGAPNGDGVTDIGDAYDAVLRMSKHKHGDSWIQHVEGAAGRLLSDSFANNCGVECDVSRCQTHTVVSCCDYTAPVFHINHSDTKYEHWLLRCRCSLSESRWCLNAAVDFFTKGCT